MIHPRLKIFSKVTLTISALLLVLFLPLIVEIASAETEPMYFVTVNPTTPDSIMYTAVGRNWTLTFKASWSYGENSGTLIQNATVTIQVNNTKNESVKTLDVNTTSGIFSFNYSSLTPEKLIFTPTKLVTQDGKEYTEHLDEANNIYGFQSKSVTVWFDTFNISLLSYNANTQGIVYVSVNVTYLLLPEEGLTLPEWATYSNHTYLPKIAHNVNVTINGVKAQETSTDGVYEANVPIWLPTAYVYVSVSQEGWTSVNTGFSFTQNANETIWKNSAFVSLGLFSAAVMISFVLLQKSKATNSSKRKAFAFFGGSLLILSSVVSFYWGLVGLDSTLHGFGWLPLTLLGFLSFGIGILAGYWSLKQRKQAAVIFGIILLILTNLFAVKFSLDMYELAIPWLIILSSFVLSIAGGVLVCNADEVFT